MAVKAYAPASIGNVSVGFDILGAALTPVDGTPLGDTVTIEDSDTEFSLVQTGSFVSKLPKNTDDNIVTDCFRVYRDALAAKGQKTRGLRMTLEKDLPVGSGLGSSACSVVSALAALNAFHDHALSEDEIIRIYGKRWDIEVFFKNCKTYLRLQKECQSLSYDAMTAHVASVMTRYMILSVYQRQDEDHRALGELFFLILKELPQQEYQKLFLGSLLQSRKLEIRRLVFPQNRLLYQKMLCSYFQKIWIKKYPKTPKRFQG